jgi:hypothetical protein
MEQARGRSRGDEMSEGNLSIRDSNICHALTAAGLDRPEETVEEMQAIYLRWKERDWRKAERAAWEWPNIADFLDISLPFALEGICAQGHVSAERASATVPEVRKFIRERFERNWFPQKSAAA